MAPFCCCFLAGILRTSTFVLCRLSVGFVMLEVDSLAGIDVFCRFSHSSQSPKLRRFPFL